MPVVFRCFSIHSMMYEAKKFIDENADNILRINWKAMPVDIEFKDGKRFLFMTTNYYETHYKLGRRKGVDYLCG